MKPELSTSDRAVRKALAPRWSRLLVRMACRLERLEGPPAPDLSPRRRPGRAISLLVGRGRG